MTQATPKGFRLHIGIYGRRNAGKSSILNAITNQQVSIVSDFAGTTTDPVEKAMELLPLGPVQFIDTAGVDDEGDLGKLRIEKTIKAFDRTDMGLIIFDKEWGDYEEEIFNELNRRSVPVIAIANKSDIYPDTPVDKPLALGINTIRTSATNRDGIAAIRESMLKIAPDDFINSPAIVGDIVGSGEIAVLVVPIDKEAPKGRLILPQVQTIRDLLDSDSYCMVVKERELKSALKKLNFPPKLVVTDSQAFLKVVADIPQEAPLTSFSVLFSRFKGDLLTQATGALAIENLKQNDKILVAEACSHHPIGEDIGRVKIPRWLTQYTGCKLDFTTIQGHDFPEDITPYKLIIHCGACTFNRRNVLSRIMKCRDMGIPVTNYGLTIAYSLGIMERALEPFPAALNAFLKEKETISKKH